jgi:hypothetical protein
MGLSNLYSFVKALKGENLKSLIYLVLLSQVACSSLDKFKGGEGSALKEIKLGAQSLNYSLEEEEKQIYQFRSSSHKKTFLNDQIINQKEEIVDFELELKAKAVNKDKGLFAYDLKTISKDGFIPLKDLGFPELNKKIPYMLDAKARVLRAGSYPPDSIYFIPSVILPDHKVQKGDTWDYEWDYRLIETGIPLRLKVTSILKRFLQCGLRTCADIEVSGLVELATRVENLNYDSELAGRMLVDVEDGSILWQRIRSGESMQTEDGRIDIFSCIESKLKSPFAKATLKDRDLDCKAKPQDSLYVEPL